MIDIIFLMGSLLSACYFFYRAHTKWKEISLCEHGGLICGGCLCVVVAILCAAVALRGFF